ncbi:MAG: ethanolamine ammonia-lyase subunit EutC [Chthoniobacteraceae bacterium]
MSNDELSTDPWSRLRRFTGARIGLGRVGAGIPTAETLRFKLAHAQARDAVNAELDVACLIEDLHSLHQQVLTLHSAAKSRPEYLRRPDLGRKLDEPSRELLAAQPQTDPDLAIVIADGLSSLAIETNVKRFLQAFFPLISGLKLAPICLVREGRVASGDEVGHLLGAKSVVMLIGERPGLSSPDSMGIYLTFAPRPGLTDERRNCISNVRDAGLPHAAAAAKLAYLTSEALRRQISGVDLKDDMVLEDSPAPKLAE